VVRCQRMGIVPSVFRTNRNADVLRLGPARLRGFGSRRRKATSPVGRPPSRKRVVR